MRARPYRLSRALPFILCACAALVASVRPAAAAERLCDVAFEDCRAPLLQLINNETVGIDVAFWFMEDSRYANALISRHQAGVPVRVIIDTKANARYPGNATMLRMLADAGVPMRERTSQYLHWKVMLFFGQNTVQFSGANYSPYAFVPVQPYADYVDEVIYFSDDPAVVNSFKTKYDDAWVSTSGYVNYANISGPLTRSHATYPIDPAMNFPPSQNFATRSVDRYNAETVGIDSIIYRIDDARHTNAILAAVGRGVPVRIISEQLQYRDPERLWHSYNIDRLYMGGVQIRHRGHAGLNHEKLTLLRGQRMTVFGSSNWTVSSSNQQNEHNYFTTKAWFYDWASAHFERKWTNSTGIQESQPFTPLPPDKPENRQPANSASGIGSSVTLRWYPGPWAHFYDVYLGTSPTTMLKIVDKAQLGPSATTSTLKSHTVSGLAPNTTYYWQVVARTAANLSRTGDVWSFRTGGGSGLPTAGPGDVVLWAGKAPTVVGNWSKTADSTAAGGYRMWNPNAGLAKLSSASASPADYFELTFQAEANVAYRLWVRGTAQSNSYNNDSVFIQFSDTVTSSGTPQYRIGTTSGANVTIEEKANAGLSGWGWADQSYGGDAPPIFFATSGAHTIRVQRREDGVSIDQIVLSREKYLTSSPGFTKNDATILAESEGTSTGDGGVEDDAGLPAGWSNADIGNTRLFGDASEVDGTFSVNGAGADIWGTADAFHFVYRELPADGAIVARVASLTGTDSWTKVGVMIRQSVDANSAHASMFVTKGKGLAFQRRPATGAESLHTAGPTGTAPRWVRLTREGALVTASASSDGATWTVVGSDIIGLDGPVLIGLAVTSHTTSATANGTFDNVTLTGVENTGDSGGGDTGGEPPPPPPPGDTEVLPAEWVNADVGTVGVAGSATELNGTFAVKGAGADVWGSTDAFHFAYRTLAGDGEIVARVASLSGSESWTKAGVMVRQSLDPGSPHGFMLVSKSKGLAFQRRTAAGGLSTHTAGPTGTAPRWVKIRRAGNTVTASWSADGVSWTVVGSDTIALDGSVLVGLAVTSHTTSATATGTFDSVSITAP